MISELTANIEIWAAERGIDKAESSKQMLKVIEEVGEVAAALCRGQHLELKDAIGDVYVTLVILAMQNDFDMYECVEAAYSEIKNRKGNMVNGVFVKEEDQKELDL